MLTNLTSKIKGTALALAFLSPMSVNAAPILWSGDSSGRLGTIDIATGDVTVIGNMGTTMTDIAFDPNGNLWGISFSDLYQIDSTTAATTHVGSLGTTANSLVFDTSGNLYTANSSLYSVDTTSGAATLIGSSGDSYSSSGDLAFVNGELYLSSAGANNNLVQLNTADGSASQVGNIGYAAVYGLASPNGTDLFGMTSTQILSIDPSTGIGTSILDYSGQGLSAAWGSAFVSEAVVPIPAAVWLFMTGMFALLGFGKRLQKRD